LICAQRLTASRKQTLGEGWFSPTGVAGAQRLTASRKQTHLPIFSDVTIELCSTPDGITETNTCRCSSHRGWCGRAQRLTASRKQTQLEGGTGNPRVSSAQRLTASRKQTRACHTCTCRCGTNRAQRLTASRKQTQACVWLSKAKNSECSTPDGITETNTRPHDLSQRAFFIVLNA